MRITLEGGRFNHASSSRVVVDNQMVLAAGHCAGCTYVYEELPDAQE